MKKFLTFILTAVLLAGASVSVLAEDAVVAEDTAAVTEAAETAAEPLTIDGMMPVVVTSSDASLDVDVSNFYDSIPETKCTITFDAEAETRTFSVYTATKVPETIANFAVIVDGEKGTVITIEVFGTNDSLLLDWTPLAFGPESLDTEYAIFSIADAATPYAFYRFDFTLELGDYFDMAELALFKELTDAPEMEYALSEVVEEGEVPALVPVTEEAEPAEAAAAEETVEEAEEEKPLFSKIPNFGLYREGSFLPRYIFLPRG